MKKLLILACFVAVFCLFSASLKAQNVRVDGVVTNRNGFPVPGASIAVCSQPASTTATPCTPLAALCVSASSSCSGGQGGGGDSPNPLTSDSLGNYSFYVKSSVTIYTAQFYGSGLTARVQPDQTLPNLSNCANVKGYGATGDGTTDDSSAIAAALVSNLCVVMPYSSTGYKVNTGLSLSAGQYLNCNNSTLFHTNSNTTLLTASGIDDWMVQNCQLKGNNGGTVAGTQNTSDIGLLILGGHRWRVSALTSYNFDGWGIKHDVGTDSASGVHGDRGQMAQIVARANYTGAQLLAGASAEYVSVSGLDSVSNTVGVLVAAGNTKLANCNITDNGTGVWLTSGSNHGHGVISGCNINHNGGTTGDNIFVDSVTLGFTFEGNHIYANASTNGFIHLSASHGVEFLGNTIDSNIKNDTADGSINSFIANRMVSNTATLAPAGTSGSTNLYLSGNYTNSGPWLYNNVAGAIAQGVPTNLAGYDLGTARDATSGALYFGSDGNKYLFRSANQLQFGGFSSWVPASDGLASLGTASLHFNSLFLSDCAAVGTAASPSVASCGAAPAGHFSCATNATGATCQVNTTVVTARSVIQVFEADAAAIGTLLGVTCNTSTNVLPASRLIASQTTSTGFVINLGTVTTNPACFSYVVIN